MDEKNNHLNGSEHKDNDSFNSNIKKVSLSKGVEIDNSKLELKKDLETRANITKLPFFTAFIGLILLTTAAIGFYSMRDNIGLSDMFAKFTGQKLKTEEVVVDDLNNWQTHVLKPFELEFKLPGSLEATASVITESDSENEFYCLKTSEDTNENCEKNLSKVMIVGGNIKFSEKGNNLSIVNYTISDQKAFLYDESGEKFEIPANSFKEISSENSVKVLLIYPSQDDLVQMESTAASALSPLPKKDFIYGFINTYNPLLPQIFINAKYETSEDKEFVNNLIGSFKYQNAKEKGDGKFLVDPNGKYLYGNTFPSEITKLTDVDLKELGCSETYYLNPNKEYLDNSFLKSEDIVVNSIISSLNKGKSNSTLIESYYICSSGESKYLGYSQNSSTKKSDGNFYFGEVTNSGKLQKISKLDPSGAPYFTCQTPIIETKDDIFYMICGGEDLYIGRKSLYKINLATSEVNKIIEYDNN